MILRRASTSIHRRWTLPLLAWLGLLTLLLVGSCGEGEKTLQEVDPAAAPLDPPFETVTAILDRNCVPCHRGGDSGNGTEAEDDDPDFDTCLGILQGLNGLLESAVVAERMPPGAWPRLSEVEKLTIVNWIQNGACSPCNPCP